MLLDRKYTMKQRRAMFYTSREMKTFGHEVQVQVKIARAIGDRVLKSVNQDCSFRGLELLVDETASHERRRRKHMGQLAVFMEQDRQFMENGNFTPLDVDTMAHRYGSIARKSQELAQQRAMLYQEMEKEESCFAAPNTFSTLCTKPTTVPQKLAPLKSRFAVGPSAA